MSQKPIVMSWDLVTRASLEDTWKALSDTDRFNKVASAGFTYVAPSSEADGARAMGSVKKLGMTILFDEKPFSFRAPHWFRIEREFQSGPAEKLVATARLTARPEGGTQIAYSIEVFPKSFLGRTILSVDLRATTQKRVDKALRALVSTLDQDSPESAYAGVPPQLSVDGEKRLKRLLNELGENELKNRLAGFIRGAPERDQARISGPGLSQAWRVQLDDVLELLLSATEVGMLGVTLDLLCPACLVPRRELTSGPMIVHCESCGIRYDADFPELLAVHFRPSRDIRPIDIKLECLGSPARSPHIAAQETLAPGAETDLATSLEPGMHQIRTLPALGPPALLEISDGGQALEVRFSAKTMIHPQLAKASHPRHIWFTNASSVPVTVVLEKVKRPQTLVTAGRLFAEFPRFRKLAPVLPFFSSVELYKATVLALTAVEEPAATLALKLTQARLVHVTDRLVFAIYPSLASLLDDGRRLGLLSAKPPSSFGGISMGTVFELDRAGKRIPMGPAVDGAYAAMQGAGVSGFVLPSRLSTDHDVIRDLSSREVTLEPHEFFASDGEQLVRLSP